MQQAKASAREVTEDLLDRSGRALMSGDFEAFLACIELPFEIETFQGKRRICAAGELRKLFEALRSDHQRQNVSHMARHVVEAVYSDDATIHATFETRLLNGTLLTQNPYPVFAVLVQTKQSWKANSMTFAIEDRPIHNDLLMGRPSTPRGFGNIK